MQNETRLLETSHCLPCRCQGNWRRERPLPPPHLTDVSAKPGYLSRGTQTSARGYLLLLSLFSLWVVSDSCNPTDGSSPDSSVFATPWTVARQAPLSLGFSRQEYWSGFPYPLPVDLPDPGIKLTSPASRAVAGRFFTSSATWEAPAIHIHVSLLP